MDSEATSETQAWASDTWRRTVSELKKWLEMAVLDLQESKKTGACAIDQSKTLIREIDIWKEKLGIHLDWWRFDKKQLEEASALEKKVQQSIIIGQEYEIASLKISLGFQKQEALRFQLRLELALDDSELLSSRLHFLRGQVGESEAQLKRNSGGCGEEIKECCGGIELNAAQLVANKLKSEHKIQIEKLKEEHCSAISKSKEERCALMREKNFVWDQLKRVEEGYCNRLSKKEGELKVAEQVIEKLESKVDELQASHADKTVEVAVLKINMQTVEEELRQVKEVLVHMKSSGITVDEEQVNNTSVDAKHIVTNKEIELKAALELVDKLQQENRNLRWLYADLEANATKKPAEKPKGVKHGWELGKSETTRNLGAELEAEANVNLVTKAVNLHHAGDEHRQNKLKSKEIQSNISTRKMRSMLDNKENNEPFPADSAREDNMDTPRGPNMGDLEKHPCQLKHGLLGNSSEQRALKKSRLFSSVFAIPKVLNAT